MAYNDGLECTPFWQSFFGTLEELNCEAPSIGLPSFTGLYFSTYPVGLRVPGATGVVKHPTVESTLDIEPMTNVATLNEGQITDALVYYVDDRNPTYFGRVLAEPVGNESFVGYNGDNVAFTVQPPADQSWANQVAGAYLHVFVHPDDTKTLSDVINAQTGDFQVYFIAEVNDGDRSYVNEYKMVDPKTAASIADSQGYLLGATVVLGRYMGTSGTNPFFMSARFLRVELIDSQGQAYDLGVSGGVCVSAIELIPGV